jgi:hypothetical protein
MRRKIHLIAASLIGLTLPVLSSAAAQAIPGGGGAFTPVAPAALMPVADVSVVPGEPQRWRSSHRRQAREWRPRSYYVAPYADYRADLDYRAYRYGYAHCCEVYAAYPAFEQPYRPYSYSHMGRYYFADDPRYYLPGFEGGPTYYYW